MVKSLPIFEKIPPAHREIFFSVLHELTSQAPNSMIEIPMNETNERHIVLIPMQGTATPIPLDSNHEFATRLKDRFEQEDFISLGEIDEHKHTFR